MWSDKDLEKAAVFIGVAYFSSSLLSRFSYSVQGFSFITLVLMVFELILIIPLALLALGAWEVDTSDDPKKSGLYILVAYFISSIFDRYWHFLKLFNPTSGFFMLCDFLFLFLIMKRFKN